jgi:hypothetical protein
VRYPGEGLSCIVSLHPVRYVTACLLQVGVCHDQFNDASLISFPPLGFVPSTTSTRRPMCHSLQLPSSLLLLSLCVALVEAQSSQIQVPDCLPAAKANWNWVRALFSDRCERSMTLWTSRHTTASNRALVRQLATSLQNARTVVRPHYFSPIFHVNLMRGNVEFTIPQLAAGGHYTGPTVDDQCQCNTVLYSVISACAGCQKGTWLTCVWFSFARYLAQ